MDHLSEQEVAEYHERRLSPAELLRADDHLTVCPACRTRLRPEENASSALHSAFSSEPREEPWHLSFEELSQFLDGTQDPIGREIAVSHIESCTRCREEVRDLEGFRELLASRPVLPIPSAPTDGSTTVSAFPRRSFLPRLLSIAAALAVGALAMWIVMRPALRDARQAREELASLREQYTALQDRIAGLNGGGPAPAPSPAPGLRLALADAGGTVGLDATGALRWTRPLTAESEILLARALDSKTLEVPAGIADLAGKSGVLLGGHPEGAPFSLLAPVGTAVRTDRPVFRWEPLGGADTYRVAVYDGNFRRIQESPDLPGTEWSPTSPLPRGETYLWQVTALSGDLKTLSPAPPAPEAKFLVLSTESAARFEEVARSLADSHLALGVAAAREGLLDDAEREMRALAGKNPGSEVPRAFLEDLRRRRNR